MTFDIPPHEPSLQAGLGGLFFNKKAEVKNNYLGCLITIYPQNSKNFGQNENGKVIVA